MKICTKCKRKLKANKFSKGTDKDGLNYWCKYCTKEYQNKPEIKSQRIKYDKKRYQKHKRKMREYSKQYNQLHKEERKVYMNNRLKKDINFRMSRYLRTRIWLALKGNPKLSTTMKLVGCSIEKLREHLEKQFKSGMSWSNYGKWHIDHIRPCCVFDLRKKSEQKKCFRYTNLQPLWAKENREKQIK